MRGARRFADFEMTDQERQRQSRQHGDGEQVKTIHEREHGSLLVIMLPTSPYAWWIASGVLAPRVTRKWLEVLTNWRTLPSAEVRLLTSTLW